jgi:very-short-patch-repair endonuclease
MKICHTCKKEIFGSSNFCNKICYYSRKDYKKHSEETKKKIAKGNSKPLSKERREKISKARTKVPSEELLQKLDELWKLTYLSESVIKEITGLTKNKRFYYNLFKDHCRYEQKKFMPSNWYPEHFSKLIELSGQNIWYKQIAKIIGFSSKQVYYISKKLGLPINTKDPNAWSCVTSKVEADVISWVTEENFKIETQFKIGNFLFDGHVKNSNILIEVNGDYWHCNPKVYQNGPINEMQKTHIKRDFAKKHFAAKEGYYLVTVWEKDIKDNPQKTKDWVLSKIKSNIVEIKND